MFNNKKMTMKKLLSILIALIFTLGLNAKTTSEISNFTATDYFGNEIDLYEILEGGQYVLLHVNTRTNGATATVTPPLVEAYKRLGCNNHDVFFIGVVPNGTTSLTKKYVEEYGIEFPMIHNTDDSNGMEGPAMDIWQALQCEMPTTMLIAPDKSIVLDALGKIETANDVMTALAPFGIEQHSCESPAVEVAIDEASPMSITATFTPSEDCASYIFVLSTEADMDMWSGMMGMQVEDLVVSWGIEETGEYTHTWNELIPNTEYTIYVLPQDAEGNAKELITKKVTTPTLGGEGVSIIDLEVEILSDTSVFVKATPNEETAVYHYILIEKAYADSIGVDTTMNLLHEDPYALYGVDEWIWTPLTSETEFYAIAQGQNAKGEWGEVTKVEFKTTTEGCIELMENNFNIYPNPATSEIRIVSEMNGEAEINIYDITGRRVKNISVSDIDGAMINISDIEKGIYIININGSFSKLVVE